MANNVKAVIAALNIALKEAIEARDNGEYLWDNKNANRWIDQLPGAWRDSQPSPSLRTRYVLTSFHDNTMRFHGRSRSWQRWCSWQVFWEFIVG